MEQICHPWLVGNQQVYSARWACDMNLFYSMGDAKVFLTCQTNCRTAESFGGCMGGLLALWLFSIDPVLPFAFSAGMACSLDQVYHLRAFCHHRASRHFVDWMGSMKNISVGSYKVSFGSCTPSGPLAVGFGQSMSLSHAKP